jgi:nucleoside-diphosphate-sugar epimerase
MKIYIIGSSGRLGSEVFKLIPEAIPITRSTKGLENEIVCDFSEASLKEILKDAECILHLAGSVDMENKKELWNTNFELTKRIVDSSPKRCRIVYASSISVYGKKPKTKPITEETVVNPDSEYSRTKFLSEEYIRKNRPNHVILRIGTLYGPKFADYFAVIKRIKEGKMQIVGKGDNVLPFVHVEDVSKAIVNSVRSEAGTYNIAGENGSQNQIYQIVAREMNVAAPKRKIPKFAAIAAYKVTKLLGKKTSIKEEHIQILASDRPFDCKKAKKELKFNPRAIEKGVIEMCQLYKKHETQGDL